MARRGSSGDRGGRDSDDRSGNGTRVVWSDSRSTGRTDTMPRVSPPTTDPQSLFTRHPMTGRPSHCRRRGTRTSCGQSRGSTERPPSGTRASTWTRPSVRVKGRGVTNLLLVWTGVPTTRISCHYGHSVTLDPRQKQLRTVSRNHFRLRRRKSVQGLRPSRP